MPSSSHDHDGNPPVEATQECYLGTSPSEAHLSHQEIEIETDKAAPSPALLRAVAHLTASGNLGRPVAVEDIPSIPPRRKRKQSAQVQGHAYSWKLVYAIKALERHCWRNRAGAWRLAAITVNLDLLNSTSLTMQRKSPATAYGDRVRDRLKSLVNQPQFFAILEDSEDGSLHAHLCMSYYPDDQQFIRKVLKADTDGSPSAVLFKHEYRDKERDRVQGDIDREMDREREADRAAGIADEDDDTAEPYALYNECDSRGRYYRMLPIDTGWADYLSKHLHTGSDNFLPGTGRLYVPRDLAQEANALHDEAHQDYRRCTSEAGRRKTNP